MVPVEAHGKMRFRPPVCLHEQAPVAMGNGHGLDLAGVVLWHVHDLDIEIVPRSINGSDNT